MGRESTRESEWLNLYVAALNSSIKVGNLGIAYNAVSAVLSGLSDIVIVFIAAKQVMKGELTIGIVTAFLAYKSQFMARIMSLVDQYIQFRMLDVYLERVADIALASPEQSASLVTSESPALRGDLELRDAVFRYSQSEKPILNMVNLKIHAGEFVVLTGASGEGKSTLLKALVGLYNLDSGEALIDDRLVADMDAGSLRGKLGIVMQDDQLLSGSIAHNIARFDRAIDLERVRECARLAQVDDEIMASPMQYQTNIGDLGTSLSAGQRQRVLLARALYGAPRVLILDEGTVNVGTACEERIIRMLRDLPATRVVVTHSPSIANVADRVFVFEQGRVREVVRCATSDQLAKARSEMREMENGPRPNTVGAESAKFQIA